MFDSKDSADGDVHPQPERQASAINQHRDPGVREHLLCFAAKQERIQTATAVRSHKDQVTALHLSDLDDERVGFVADTYHLFTRHTRGLRQLRSDCSM